jgi:hypothetical protein
VAEAVLVLVHVIPLGLAIAVAAAVVALHLVARERITWPPARTALRSVALSQALILFVPLLLALAGWLILSVVALVGAVVLVLVLLDR